MPQRIYTIGELPEEQPLPLRLYALGADYFLETGSLLTPELKRSLRAMGIGGFVVHPPGQPPSLAPLTRAQIAAVVSDLEDPRRVPLELRRRMLGAISPYYDDPSLPLQVEALAVLVEQIARFAALIPGPPLLTPRVRAPKRYLPYHAVDSTLWAAYFGVRWDLDRPDLIALITAALLRDVGASASQAALLYSAERLDAAQRRHVREHPLHTITWLARNELENDAVHQAVRQHHERNDGKGYPLQLPGSLIAPAAQLLALTDTFVALAADRPWRARHTLSESVQGVIQGTGSRFAPSFARDFAQHVGAYPPGSILELDHRAQGIVLDAGGPRRYRPLVRIIERVNGHATFGAQVDLARRDTAITAILH